MKPCDNINSVHDITVINETPDGIRTRCKICGQIDVLRCDKDGRFNNKQYSKIFKRDILQPSDNLYYKIFPEKMSII